MKISVIDPFSHARPLVHVSRTLGGQSLGQIVPAENRPHVQCLINGLDAGEHQEWSAYVPHDQDDIQFITKTGFVAVPALIAVGVSATTAVGIAAAVAAITPYLIAAAVSVGIGFAIRALTPKPKLGFTPLGGASAARREEAFGVAGLTNTVSPGTPKFVVYGERRVFGHVIGTRIEVAPDGKSMAFSALYFLGDSGGDGYESISEIQVNRTPVEDLEGVTTEVRLGTDPQAVINDFEEVAQTYFDGRALAYNTSVTYTLNDTNASRAHVIIEWPGGLKKLSQTTGESLPGKSEIKLEYKRVADPSWILHSTNVVEKKSESKLFQEFKIQFGSADAWEIRVTEVHDKNSTTPPTVTADPNLFNIEEIQTTTRTYAGSALLAVKGVGTNVIQTLSQLEVSALVRGKKVKIWNGSSFDAPAWTQKRAWIVRDLLTHAKIGLGHRVAEAFHDDDAAKWVQDNVWDTTVDGLDGEAQEIMDLCDVVINEKRAGWDWIKELLAEGRAAYIPSGGKYKMIVDSAKSPDLLYASGKNIIEGSMKRELGFENKSINTLRGEFPDNDKDFKTNVVELQDSGIGSDPIKDLNFTFLSLTREGNVYRELMYHLKRRVLVKRRFKWFAPMGALLSEPLDVVRLSYRTFNFKRGWSGILLKPGTGSPRTWYLDKPVTLESGKSYRLFVRRTGLGEAVPGETEDIGLILNAPGTYGTVQTNETGAGIEGPGTMWAIGEDGVGVIDALIESIKDAKNGQFELTASEYFSAVYTQDPLPSRSGRRFFRIPQTAPLPLWDASVVEETILNHDGSTASVIVFDVTPGLVRSSGKIFFADNGHTGGKGRINLDAATLPTPTTGLTSSDDGYFKNARAKVRTGGAAGFEALIESHPPDQSVGEVLLLDTAFSTIPAQDDLLEIVREEFEATGGFIIELGESSSGPWTEIAEVKGFHHEMDASGDARTLWYRFTPVSIRGVRNSAARWIKSVAFTGDTSAPAAPTNVNITVTVSRAKLSWDNPSAIDFDRVRIYRHTTNDFSGASLVAELRATAYVDDQLAADTYYYWLSAVDFSGNEGARHRGDTDGQAATVISVFDSTAPGTPDGPSLNLVTSVRIANDGNFIAEIRATWNANGESDLAGYIVQWRKSSEPDWDNSLQMFVDTNAALIDFLEGDTSYDVRVRAVDTSGNKSGYNTEKSVTTSDTPGAPAQVANVQAASFPMAILVTWDQNAELDIAYYEVELDTTGDNFTGDEVVLGRVNTTSIVDHRTTPNALGWYRVRAVRRTGTPGNWSATANGSTSFIISTHIQDGHITETKILNTAVTTPKLAANAVTAAKILAGEINSTHLTTASAVITNAIQIANALIQTVHIGSAQITEALIANLAVATAKIKDLNVTTIKIANNAVTNKGEDQVTGSVGLGTGTTLASVTLTFNAGTSVLIIGKCDVAITDNADSADIWIELDGSTDLNQHTVTSVSSGEKRTAVCLELNTPGSGSHTYRLKGTNQGTSSSASERVLIVTEYIK